MNRDQVNNNEILFLQFKKGEEKAFEYYYNLYFKRILGFCIPFIHDIDKAQSIVQDAFVELWIRRHKVKNPTGIKAFLYTRAKSDCLNLLRHSKVVEQFKLATYKKKEDQLRIEVLNAIKFDSAMVSESDKLISKAIAELPPRCKCVFLMRRNENKKNKEIAIELGITVKAVEANMSRATRMLVDLLSEYLP